MIFFTLFISLIYHFVSMNELYSNQHNSL
ncbi:hypothetical protein [Escherichia phage IMM-001]|nr:hypothetical protein [Escherichia phage IMM-001]